MNRYTVYMSLRVSVTVVCLWRNPVRSCLYCFTTNLVPSGHLLHHITELYAVAVTVFLWCASVRGWGCADALTKWIPCGLLLRMLTEHQTVAARLSWDIPFTASALWCCALDLVLFIRAALFLLYFQNQIDTDT
jgi:hypothetical protein